MNTAERDSQAKILKFNRELTPESTATMGDHTDAEVIELSRKLDPSEAETFDNFLRGVLKGHATAETEGFVPAVSKAIEEMCWSHIIIRDEARAAAAYRPASGGGSVYNHPGGFTLVLRQEFDRAGSEYQLERGIYSDGNGHVLGRKELAKVTPKSALVRPDSFVAESILGRGALRFIAETAKRRDEEIRSFGLTEMLPPDVLNGGPIGLANDPSRLEIAEIFEILKKRFEEGDFEYYN